MTLESEAYPRAATLSPQRGRGDLQGVALQWVPPELSEGQDEIVRALAGMLPELVTDADIKGILHAHTERSDGADTLATMVEATLARGYEYFGVADHSKSAHYAGGLNAAQVAEQQAEAERLNKKYGRAFRVFKGIESDILKDAERTAVFFVQPLRFRLLFGDLRGVQASRIVR